MLINNKYYISIKDREDIEKIQQLFDSDNEGNQKIGLNMLLNMYIDDRLFILNLLRCYCYQIVDKIMPIVNDKHFSGVLKSSYCYELFKSEDKERKLVLNFNLTLIKQTIGNLGEDIADLADINISYSNKDSSNSFRSNIVLCTKSLMIKDGKFWSIDDIDAIEDTGVHFYQMVFPKATSTNEFIRHVEELTGRKRSFNYKQST